MLRKFEITLAKAIASRGGYRETGLFSSNPIYEKGETWNREHKVVYILEREAGSDGYRYGCAVDLVTGSIVG